MDPAYISAIAALAGSAIGGLTSLAASWLSQNVQARACSRRPPWLTPRRRSSVDIYFQPNMTFSELHDAIRSDRIDVMRTFSEAARDDLRIAL